MVAWLRRLSFRLLAIVGLLLCMAPSHAGSAPAATLLLVTARSIAVAAGGEILGLSPNGALQAVYVGKQLCAYRTATWTPVRCTKRLPFFIDDGNVRWSPDSTRLAYTENWELYAFDADIWVFDIATGKQRDLTDDHFTGPMLNPSKQGMPVYIDSTPTWSPAGDAIYFARTAIVGGNITPHTAIYRIPAGGGTPRLVVDAAPDKAFALWYGMALVASGTRIVYTLDAMALGDKRTGLYVADLPNGAARKVVAGDRKFGAPFLLGLTPDGTSAVVWYAEGTEDPTTPPHANLVFVANLQTGALQSITPVQVPAASGQTGVVLSSDGTKLLYVYRSSSGHATVVVHTLRTGAETTVSFPGEHAPEVVGVLRLGWGMSWANNTVYLASEPNKGVLLTMRF